MSKEALDDLYQALTSRDAGKDTGNDAKNASGPTAGAADSRANSAVADNGEDEEKEAEIPRKRLTQRQATMGLFVLVLLLLAFFLGMRLIDSRAQKLSPPAVETQTAEVRSADQTGKININTATLTELKSLSGIGDKKAQAIIDHRSEYGPFYAVEEIMEVDGIGEGIFEAIKDDICV